MRIEINGNENLPEALFKHGLDVEKDIANAPVQDGDSWVLGDRAQEVYAALPADWDQGWSANAAKERVDALVLDTLAEIAGHPTQIETASWANKLVAANRVISGESVDDVSLKRDELKYSVDAKGAAGIIVSRARLMVVATAATEIMADLCKAQLDAATDAQMDAIEAGFATQIADRKAEFALIVAQVKLGNLASLEAAEAEISGV